MSGIATEARAASAGPAGAMPKSRGWNKSLLTLRRGQEKAHGDLSPPVHQQEKRPSGRSL